MKRIRVVVFAGGAVADPACCRALLEAGDYIICADGGTAHALALGVVPDLVIGDADSLDEAARRRLADEPAVSFERYPRAKDKSDLELALDRAVALKPREIVIFGALGGDRVEHTLANMLLLAVPLRAGIPARILDGPHEIRLANQELAIGGEAGDYVSLFPLAGPAAGVVTQGLKYPLRGETLHFSSTRGLSNELLGPRGRVTLREGLLLVIRTARRRPGQGD